jgi:hypothetical protein
MSIEHFSLFCYGLTEGTLTEGKRLSMIDLLIKLACFAKK